GVAVRLRGEALLSKVRATAGYFLNLAEAFSKALFIDAHAVSTPASKCRHADSLEPCSSSSFLNAVSRVARMVLSCSANFARASAPVCSLLALSLSTSASLLLFCHTFL